MQDAQVTKSLVSKMFDILIVFLEEFLKKAHLKKSADDKKQEKIQLVKKILQLLIQGGVQGVSLEPSSLPLFLNIV